VTDKRQRLTECERRDSWLQVVTAVLLRADDVQPSVRWWIILLAVLAGLVLLALLVLLMWKVRLRSVSVAFVITHLHLVMLFSPVCSFVFYMVVQKSEALPTGQRKRIETRKRSWIFHQI